MDQTTQNLTRLSQRRERTIAKIDTDRDRMYLILDSKTTRQKTKFFLMLFYAHKEHFFLNK